MKVVIDIPKVYYEILINPDQDINRNRSTWKSIVSVTLGAVAKGTPLKKEKLFIDSITPQPKTGRWIGCEEICERLGLTLSGSNTIEYCSNCDFGIDISEELTNNYNYCPCCGARMEKPIKII